MTPPKTIQIFLPTGQPRGIRIAEITTRIIQAVAVPRAQLDTGLARRECSHVAVYLLFGHPEDSAKPKVYIGQTEDLRMRLKDHDAKKEFWQTAVFIISRTQTFTQAHIRYLEWLFIKRASEAGRYVLDNGNAGSEPFTTEPMKADLADAYETASTLLGTLGFPVFEPLVSRKPAKERLILHCTGPQADAQGEWTEDGMVVLKGSKCRKELVDSVKGTFLENRVQRLVQEGILAEHGNQYVFQEDYAFNSPSGAAMTVLGRTANGWIEWRDGTGKTLRNLRDSA